MRDHLTEELISAYVDGELADDERVLVQRMLRESNEHQQLFEELQGLSSALQELPKFRLDGDFHLRVLDKIEQVEDAETIPIAELVIPTRRNSSRTWWAAALGIAAVAAAIVLAVALNRPDSTQNVVDNKNGESTSGPRAREPFTPDDSWYDEQFVYYVPQAPKADTFTTVVDLILTQKGQQNRTFERVFRQVRVPFDPEMKLDPELEEGLLRIERLGNVQRVPKREAGQVDEVELVYVICETGKAAMIIDDLRALSDRGDEIDSCEMGFLHNPPELEMMYKLNRSSVAQFADPNSSKSKRSLFHRLVFSVKLSSTSLPELASIPILVPKVAESRDEPQPRVEQLAQDPTEVLFVIRKLKGHRPVND